MTTLDDLDVFDATDRPALGAKPRCRRHQWFTVIRLASGAISWSSTFPLDGDTWVTACHRCNAVQDPAVSRRGRTNRSRGNAIERDIGKRLGLRRVGQYGGPVDLAGELFAAQVKSGSAFPERLWNWLRAVPVNAGQTPLLVVTDAPGPGHRRRALVVTDLESWIALHGPTEGVA